MNRPSYSLCLCAGLSRLFGDIDAAIYHRLAHMHFGVTGGAVGAVLIGGPIVMDSKQLLAIDEREVMAKSRGAAAEMWKRL